MEWQELARLSGELVNKENNLEAQEQGLMYAA
jgi:hypothetical protein